MERRLQDRVDRRHERLLQITEAAGLEAHRVNLLTARRKARRVAKAMVLTAAEWRDEQSLPDVTGAARSRQSPSLLERLQRAATQPEPVLEPHEPQRPALLRRLDSILSMLLGRRIRLLLGILLLSAFAVWVDRKGILTSSQVRDQAVAISQVVQQAFHSADLHQLRDLRWELSVDWRRLTEPLELTWPTAVAGTTQGANLAVSALILLASCFFRRRLTGFLALLGSILCLMGPAWRVGIPGLSSWLDQFAQMRMLGVALLIIGLLWPSSRIERTGLPRLTDQEARG